MSTRLLKPAELNHLRRLLGWVACELGQPPEEMEATLRHIAGKVGNDISEEGRQRIEADFLRSQQVPKYVWAALKSLRTFVHAADRAGATLDGESGRGVAAITLDITISKDDVTAVGRTT